MGISSLKRVAGKLHSSSEFTSACDTGFENSPYPSLNHLSPASPGTTYCFSFQPSLPNPLQSSYSSDQHSSFTFFLLPEGFEFAPTDRISPEIKEKMGNLSFWDDSSNPFSM
ncbi:hypothetical protein R6Q59_018348 [Mikania micrantha]